MQVINLDLSVKGVIPLLHAKQGDVGRKFKAILTDGGEAYPVPAGAAVSVWYSGASGTGNYTDIGTESAVSVSGNEITVELITQMLATPGEGVVCLVLSTAAGDELGMWNINYCVEPRPGMNSVAAQEYYTAFSKAVSELPYPDESLSVAGKAADAAATGTELAGKAPAGYGLGTTTQKAHNDDPNEITKTGFYSAQHANLPPYRDGRAHIFHIEGTGGYAIQFSFDFNDQLHAIRKKLENVWQEWEFETQPMKAGYEYRTTERWNGKPVYKKLIEYTNPEAIGGTMTLSIPHSINGLDMILTASCTTSNYLLPYLTAGSSLCITGWNSTNLSMISNSSWGAGRKWYIELRYTKSA